MKKMSIKREAWFMVVMVKVRRRTRGSSEETVSEEHKGLELIVIEIPSWRASTQMGRGRAVKKKGVFEMLDPLAWTCSELGIRTPS